MYYFVRLVRGDEPAFFKNEDEDALYAEVLDLDLDDSELEACVLVTVPSYAQADGWVSLTDFKSALVWLAEMQE